MEYLQVQPGEDEETAWRRLRPKLSYTGRQLDEVFLLQPSAVPTSGGAASPGAPQSGEAGGLLGGDNVGQPAPPIGGVEPGTPDNGGIFNGDGSPNSKPRVILNNPATSALNLIGKLEGWGIGPATQVAEVSIKVSTANGAQIKEMLKKLPDGMTFELTLEKEDN